MTTWFISRHPGAKAWVKRKGISIDRWCDHLSDIRDIQAGDVVMGTLPIHLAGEVCARGATFYFLSIEILPHQRGQELTADDLNNGQARLIKYFVKKEEHDE
ncbi:CRISPR-associated protein Csx16 [Basilea psittacipulmonis]|uniref:CRISPR-associated protein n=1 Tax=Basilea psittacipulmonis DSM 24701 TaxID=1072685 RepID=A0A077DE01_9BURK|nr:CRISPR-associated protein Csx16 [Basilea psittacipulmonis]AIL32869.1 CRISPR-associated protein [Basilea psittacipulmonis DSM 24701]